MQATPEAARHRASNKRHLMLNKRAVALVLILLDIKERKDMEKAMRHALVIGDIFDNRSKESELFMYDERWLSEPVQWALHHAVKNGFYFDNEEEVKAFSGKVIEYAKELYKEYLKSKEKTE